jgi:hypothetical protein
MLATTSRDRSPVCLEPNRRTLFSASRSLPWRTSHQGDSGAKYVRVMSGMGQIHWVIYGIRHAQLDEMFCVRTVTPVPTNPPESH